MTIDIIVPIYHGKRYIRDIIVQAEENAKNVSGEVRLLLVNDDPADPIEKNWNSDTIAIQIIDTDVNRGIHGARLTGLESAQGECVLFLDQDDKIAPNYLKKQLAVLGTADAVVCGLIQDGKKFYHPGRTLQESICKDSMMQKGNLIISPGQVLLRRKAIPVFWKSNILKHNGADDWFLWICMLCGGKYFTYNEEILFEHVVHADNTSASGFDMLDSMHEVYETLKKNTDCTTADLSGIRRLIEIREKAFVKERDKFREMFFMLDDWMNIREQGRNIADYIRAQGHKYVSVYGRGRVGLRLAEELQAGQIQINCFIDQNAGGLPGNIKTVLPDEWEEIQEPVIITLVHKDAEAVGCLLKEKGAEQVYFLFDIIRDLKNLSAEDKADFTVLEDN